MRPDGEDAPDSAPAAPDADLVLRQVQNALAEDLGDGDLSAALIPDGQRARGRIVCRQQAVLCGAAWADQAFLQLDGTAAISWRVRDGQRLQPGQCVARIEGASRALLGAERTAINFLQTLSATATAARTWADARLPVRILDTRKTLPGLRLAQKYAVRCGGCANHRLGLYDAILIKENHLAACGGVAQALARARQLVPDAPLQLEVESTEQLQEALAAGCNHIMLDNFSDADIKRALAINSGATRPARLECSGDMDLARARKLAAMGVHDISVGALTKHCRAVDFSMSLQAI